MCWGRGVHFDLEVAVSGQGGGDVSTWGLDFRQIFLNQKWGRCIFIITTIIITFDNG
jgi:hypothetical protein